MSDVEFDERCRELLMKLSGEERVMMGCIMWGTARALAEASIRQADPDITVAALRKALFLRFYGHEFDDRTRAKILASIEAASL